MPSPLTALLKPFLRDRLLHILLVAGVVLTLYQPAAVSSFPRWIDWPTIVTLIGLMLLTKSVELSGYFVWLGRRLTLRMRNERTLALFLVSTSALLSTFLTNDVALFIVVPLTVTLKKLVGIPVRRLIIFEALAVNVGSLLTPIGNPQNILLWNRSGVGFLTFIQSMLPLAAVLMVLLWLAVWLFFPSRTIRPATADAEATGKRTLLWACLLLYVAFIVLVDLKMAFPGLLLVAIALLFLDRRVLLAIDWPLILVFIAMFIDVKLLSQLPFLQPVAAQAAALHDGGLYLTGILLSQVISNVPATIMMLNFVPSGVTLAYAVNIGGFGFALGSMANLIALRLANESRIWLRFHAFSIPALLLAALLGWLLLPASG